MILRIPNLRNNKCCQNMNKIPKPQRFWLYSQQFLDPPAPGMPDSAHDDGPSIPDHPQKQPSPPARRCPEHPVPSAPGYVPKPRHNATPSRRLLPLEALPQQATQRGSETAQEPALSAKPRIDRPRRASARLQHRYQDPHRQRKRPARRPHCPQHWRRARRRVFHRYRLRHPRPNAWRLRLRSTGGLARTRSGSPPTSNRQAHHREDRTHAKGRSNSRHVSPLECSPEHCNPPDTA